MISGLNLEFMGVNYITLNTILYVIESHMFGKVFIGHVLCRCYGIWMQFAQLAV